MTAVRQLTHELTAVAQGEGRVGMASGSYATRAWLDSTLDPRGCVCHAWPSSLSHHPVHTTHTRCTRSSAQLCGLHEASGHPLWSGRSASCFTQVSAFATSDKERHSMFSRRTFQYQHARPEAPLDGGVLCGRLTRCERGGVRVPAIICSKRACRTAASSSVAVRSVAAACARQR